MSSASEMQKVRIINELREFIKKLLQDPAILEQSLTIARAHYTDDGDNRQMWATIANEISDNTSVHIPEDPNEHSEADRLFLEVLKEVVDEGKALY
ncbi:MULTISPECIES: hypothetical protein [Chromohalobacter]|uniref:Uncharacterized protein n=1 Tax=Chromohalobacter canadensis TaxID=141389 RepID=A0A285VMS0_9GAMM|nr:MULTISPECIES: hypothetical protein [Chromohalobacter]MCK0769122.1 hypothetical protein [Chromohalobacter canadensis]WQH09412.1 hypothetical protein SR908_01765 [Chromohalobacter canadensis]SOC55370.1 hypothetical protein SAMN05421509_105107 [Chromohalobacter canadensis]